MKILGLPFSKEKSFYPQPTELQNDVPKEIFYQIEKQNKELIIESQEKDIDLYVLREENKGLIRKLKGSIGAGTSGIRKAKKRSHVDDAQASMSVATKDYEKALKVAEERSKEVAKLQNNQCQYEAKIKELEAQLKAEKTKVARALFLKHESDLELEGVLEENEKLQAEVDKRYTGPVMLPVADCEDCPKLIAKLEQLDIKLHQKDVVIEGLLRYRDYPRTKRLYDETRAWSKEYFRQGSPLYYLEME